MGGCGFSTILYYTRHPSPKYTPNKVYSDMVDMFLKFGIVNGIPRMGSLNHPSFIHTLYFSPVLFALRVYAFYLKFEMYRFSNRSSRIKKISGAKNEVVKRTSGESYFAHQERGYEVAAGPYLTQEYPYYGRPAMMCIGLIMKKGRRMRDERRECLACFFCAAIVGKIPE